MQNDHNRQEFSLKGQHWPAKKVHFILHKGKKTGFRMPFESHKGNEFFYVDYGEMVVELWDLRIVLGPGDGFITPAETIHSIHGRDRKPFSFLNLTYQGSVPENIANCQLNFDEQEKNLVFELRKEVLSEQVFYQSMVLIKLNLLLLLLSRNRHIEAMSEIPEKEDGYLRRSDVVNKALNILRRESTKTFNPRQIANQAGISSSHLRRLVKKETGISLAQHLKLIRIEQAKHLLIESSDNISEISRRVGYESPPHFCNLFKKVTGMTPGQYAKSLLVPGKGPEFPFPIRQHPNLQ